MDGETIDKRGTIGARWWQESIAAEVSRRSALKGLGALAGVLGAMTLLGTSAATCGLAVSGSSGEPEVDFQQEDSLDMQREFGWNFGATGDALVFDGTSTAPWNKSSLDTLDKDLSPGNSAYAPYFVPTLFQSPNAVPKSKPTGDPDAPPFKPLSEVITPIATPAMTTAFNQGKALAALLAVDPRAKDVAVIVDLPGPTAVAFAAGMAGVCPPVFLFDNWPHPRGVVAAHLTLAAAIYYQPLFAKARAQSATARPVFVLDRNRLANYVDDATQFDNRHTAKVPTSNKLVELGVRHLLYVGPSAVDRFELDDLVDDFLAYASAKLTFHVCPATAFEQGAEADDPFWYGGSAATNPNFWSHWDSAVTLRTANEVQFYTPRARTTPFSSGTPTSQKPSTSRTWPASFGTVPVAIAANTGLILGALSSRSGSWNRTTSGCGS